MCRCIAKERKVWAVFEATPKGRLCVAAHAAERRCQTIAAVAAAAAVATHVHTAPIATLRFELAPPSAQRSNWILNESTVFFG